MNKRQAKKWRKKHFVTVSLPCFVCPAMDANMRSYSPDIMLGVEMTFKLKTNPYKPPKLYKDNNNE